MVSNRGEWQSGAPPLRTWESGPRLPVGVLAMPHLTIRRLGMSYLVAGLDGSGLDVEKLRQAMVAAYGIAVGVMADATDSVEEESIEGLIVDRKAESWEGFLGRLNGWVGD